MGRLMRRFCRSLEEATFIVDNVRKFLILFFVVVVAVVWNVVHCHLWCCFVENGKSDVLEIVLTETLASCYRTACLFIQRDYCSWYYIRQTPSTICFV